MVLAGIVLYNPEKKRLLENITKIINQVDKVILIDNNSCNYDEIANFIKNIYTNVDIIHNEKNQGIAYALNQILDYAYNYNFEWFITLDQDSIVDSNLINNYQKYEKIDKVSMISCEYKDLNIDNPQSNFNGNEYIEITRCITSAAYCNTKILKECNGFDNKMFIDYVDFDICTTLIEKGYKIIKINYVGFLHEIGKSTSKELFGKKVILYNHSPLRVYYYVRNALYYIKKHRKNINVKENYFSLSKRIFLILFFEKNKIKNIKQIVKAIKDSKKMKEDN